MLSFCSCQEGRKNIYVNIDNPRNLGKLTPYILFDGKRYGQSGVPGPDTQSVHEYLCAMAIFGKKDNGTMEHVYYYDVNKKGAFDSIQYVIRDLKEEEATTPASYTPIDAPGRFQEFTFVFHSLREETGLRVFRTTREIVMKSDELHPIQVPDLFTLPTIKEVPESARLLELYAELKKYEEFKPK